MKTQKHTCIIASINCEPGTGLNFAKRTKVRGENGAPDQMVQLQLDSRHVYIYSEYDDIEVGDLIICPDKNTVFLHKGEDNESNNKNILLDFDLNKYKVLATTNPLFVHYEDSPEHILNIPKYIVNKFIKLDGVAQECVVEYVKKYSDVELTKHIDWDKFRGHDGEEERQKEIDKVSRLSNMIKPKSIDDSIAVTLEQKTFTRDEVIRLCRSAHESGDYDGHSTEERFIEWLDEQNELR